jgi:hypothetical protein
MHSEGVPRGLSSTSAGDRGVNIGVGRRVELAQDFASRWIQRNNLSRYLEVSDHAWCKVYAGEGARATRAPNRHTSI